jgi:outer membrane protein assembly factor BamA
MIRSLPWLGGAFVLLALASQGWAQEPETRADELRRQREEKAKQLEPPKSSAAERWLLRLEQGRLFERLLNPPEGFYPKIGNITPGSGFAAGPGYRRSRLFGESTDLSAFAAFSTMRYWIMEGRLRMPRLAGERVAVDVYGRRSDYRHEPFYGLGQDSERTDEAFYALKNTAIGGGVTVTPLPWLSFGGSTEVFQPKVRGIDDDVSIDDRFTPLQAPGLREQPRFLRHAVTAEVNYREPRGNPRRGGKYAVAFQKYVDREEGRFSFDRVEIDLQQYVPLLRDRRVLALRAAGSLVPDDAAVVPFYLQRTLGGPDDLRGFRRFRFRDENVLLLQAEYRWEIFTAVDGALFYDAGTVASRPSELSLGNLDTDYGIGFRFGTTNGVFLRIEAAFGSREGKHFILRYGHVF